MNPATRCAWNRNKSQGRLRLPKPTRLGWTLLIGALILIAGVRLAFPTHRPDASLTPFKGPGTFKLEKQMKDNYAVFLDLLNDKQRQINDLKLKQGQLPGVSKP